MKRLIPMAVFVFSVLWPNAVVMTACGAACLLSISCAATGTAAGDNAVTYLQVEKMYASTVRTMTSLANAGKVDLEDAEEFDRYRTSASHLLDEWRASVMDGQPFSGWDSLESVLEEMIRMQVEASGK